MRAASLPLFTVAVAFCALAQQPTYYKDIAPLVQTKCQQCHQPNQIAPTSFLTYDDVATYSPDIQRVLAAKIMPPWKPVPGYGEFRNSYGLSDADRQLFLDWISAGTPAGDPNDAPPPVPVNESPWQLGTPDAVLQAPAYTPSRTVPDTYRCFTMPGFDDTRWLNATEAIPGARKTVHHILLFLDESGQTAALDGQDGQPGYDCFGDPGTNAFSSLRAAIGSLLGTWVPGARVQRLDPGIGILVPGKSRIVMQVHYHPNGISVEDQTQVGFYFAPNDSVQHRLLTLPVVNTKFQIPANESSYEVTASFNVPFFLSGKAILVQPHMHLLGRQMKLELIDSNKNLTPLVRIDDWDFNWQGAYAYTDPVTIGANSTVKLTAIYDNSDQNPKNPNYPVRPVGWGEGTNDEMALTFLGVILDNEGLLALLQ